MVSADAERQAVTMARRSYSSEDVQTHTDGYRDPLPAVNVKVYTTIEQAWDQYQREEMPDPGFTLEWIEDNVSEDLLQARWENACEFEYECFEEWATTAEDSLFPGDNVTLEVQGRSGGWIAVRGLPDLEDWDAVLLARWRKFERIARDIADGIPYQVLSLLYINDYEWAQDEQREAARAANLDIATLERTP
jgi:hypothetical protein